MAYTVTKLINDAYYASGIVSREFETVGGSQLQDGFGFLNDILADKAIEKDMIPYYLKHSFDAVVGQDMYFIKGLTSAESLVFFVSDVRYQTMQTKRDRFFSTARADNIQSLPFSWHAERCLNGSNVFLYFSPDKNYPIEIWGLFSLEEVNLNQDLSLTIERFYINYLKFALADRLCSEFNFVVPAGVEKQLTKYEMWIQSRSAKMDLSLKKISTLSGVGGINYGSVNLGGGWTV